MPLYESNHDRVLFCRKYKRSDEFKTLSKDEADRCQKVYHACLERNYKEII